MPLSNACLSALDLQDLVDDAGGCGGLLTSPDKIVSDINYLLRALKNGWQIRRGAYANVPDRLLVYIFDAKQNGDPKYRARVVLKAIQLLMAMKRDNDNVAGKVVDFLRKVNEPNLPGLMQQLNVNVNVDNSGAAAAPEVELTDATLMARLVRIASQREANGVPSDGEPGRAATNGPVCPDETE